MVSDADKAAITALLIRASNAFGRREIEAKAVEDAKARLAEADAAIKHAQAAFLLFGIDVSNQEGWQIVRGILGDEEYVSAVNGGRYADLPKVIEHKPQEPSDIDELFTAVSDRPTVRDVALDRLKAAGNKGIKASDIRDFYEKTYGNRLHEKTVGMTLYRLSLENLVRRQGRIWFFVPPPADAKNPGVGAPGSEDLL